MNITEMMQQAKEMQEQLRKQMAETQVEASVGGGMVTVVMDGSKQVRSIRIDPSIVSPTDVEMLQDLVVAAINDASRRVDEKVGASMQGLFGRLKIPGLS